MSGSGSSRWSQIAQYPELIAQLQAFYHQLFPIEVRYFLCTWFEDKKWYQMDPDNPNHETAASELLKEMLTQLRNKVQDLTGDDLFIVKMRLEQACTEFQTRYQHCPLDFLRVIKQCVQKEAELFELLSSQMKSPEDMEPNDVPTEVDEARSRLERANQEITTKLQKLLVQTQETERKYKEVQHKQESFIIQYQENVKIANHIAQVLSQIEALKQQLRSGPNNASHNKVAVGLQERQNKQTSLENDKKRVETQLSELGKLILGLRIELANMYNTTINELKDLQMQILDDELIGWKRRQQLGGNGLPPAKYELDILQQWCESLAELIWSIRQQIKRMGILRAQLPIDLPENIPDLLPDLNDTITGLLSSLVTSTFIVEQQPPQVLKKEARFSATVRLLVGGKLNVQMNPPQVRATIISEHQAKCLLRSDIHAKAQVSGTILNNTGTMDFQPHAGPNSSGSLSVHFRNMQLKQIKRSDKKGSEAVTEEKFCILFQSDFNVGGNDLVFQVWTLSLPVVVTVHGNQECNAMATVLWDNAFSEPGRVPFVVPDSVLWPKLGEQLSNKFKQGAGRGLTYDNLNYLASKIFGGTSQTDYSKAYVSWVQFNKDTLKDRNFTFWEWFYAILKMVKEHVKGPWTDGSIIGFISKSEAQECLTQCENGTFLLRFSDSECGGITIAWIAETSQNDREVWNLAPYITRDFAIRGLADRINDLKNLTTLFPNIPKDEAFGKYYASVQDQDQPNRNGYVATHLVNVMVPPQPGAPMCDLHGTSTPSPPPPTSPSIAPSSMAPSLPDTDVAMDELAEYLATDYDTSDAIIDANPFIHNTSLFSNFRSSS